MSENARSDPTWVPSTEVMSRANVTAVCRELGVADYSALHRWSVEHRAQYWALVIQRLGVRLRRPYTRLLDDMQPTRPRWLIGARMNIVESCLQADDAATAVIESGDDGKVRTTSYGELRRQIAIVANALVGAGIKPGDTVGIVMPMNGKSVAAYLGVIAAGAAVVSVADSFAPEEIATRLKLGGARRVITQDQVSWGNKRLPLYEKVVAADAPPAVVVLAAGDGPGTPLRAGDQTWDHFVEGANGNFKPVEREPDDLTTILFSSGTTGEPKAIPWDHTTPIKCAADAHFHQDVHCDDIICWPTSLGWMMGPWLIFSALINRAALALFGQSPMTPLFGHFVQEARVSVLGVVPSMIRSWRQSGCMTHADWSAIRAFSSTGECSNAGDMAWLMQLAGGRPIIEYCGGTEIGGAYVTSTVVQPNIPSAFSTPALGLDIRVLDETGEPTDRGEAFLVGPSIGLSTRLLNRDHDAVYFQGTPRTASPRRAPLRRHGDELERLPNGYYRAIGRCDDTMNLGGIKVGCAEIERVLNPLPGVLETAAIAIAPPGGGPSRLIVFVVPRPGAALEAGPLKHGFQEALRKHLNPLFRVEDVRVVASLPRTASNKVMRRELRNQYITDVTTS